MREHLLTHKAMLLRICARQRLASQIQARSFEESFHRGTVLRFDVSGCILWGEARVIPTMKKILIVNNNMKIGGVQKSLCNLLWSVADQYDITLYLFAPIGAYMHDIPPQVHVLSCDSLFRYLGTSQKDCSTHWRDYFIRGILACVCKLFGRKAILPLLLRSQEQLQTHYDCAISYLHNGATHRFYGGVNEFVLKRVSAERKIAFLHCDYMQCGANREENNAAYKGFDTIAACSRGCRSAFIRAMPELAEKCRIVPNFHQYEKIRALAAQAPYCYADGQLHVLMVARLAHEKGVDRAIRALGYVRAQGISVVLHLVGNGPKEQELRTLSHALGLDDAVLFHGDQANPYRFMRNADLLLITSYHEAAPMVIDEARCLGLPVLSTATTSAQEMIIDRGCGWVCDNSQFSINHSLEAVLQNQSGLEHVRSLIRFSDVGNKKAMDQLCELIGK